MGNYQSQEYNPYTGTYEYNSGYQTELERYWRMRYPQYNSYYPSMASAYAVQQPSYYNAYQQQYYQPTYQSAYNTFNGYNNGGLYASPYYQQTAYNAYNTPLQYGSTLYGTPTAYGTYNNTYYPNYLQRTYM